MPVKVIMPQLGESVYECTVTKWLKEVGAKISLEEPLFEVSTDKVDSEIPSPAEGILEQILVPEGENVKVGAVVAILADSVADDIASPQAENDSPDSPAAADSEPESLTSARAENGEGEAPDSESLLAGADAEQLPSEGAGTPISVDSHSLDAEAGIDASSEEEAVAGVPERVKTEGEVPPEESAAIPVPRKSGSRIRTSPLVRRLAREHGIDLAEVKGTGLSGRITRKDFFALLEGRSAQGATQVAEHVLTTENAGDEARAATTPPAELPQEVAEETVMPLPDTPAAVMEDESPGVQPGSSLRHTGETEIVKMTPMRKAIAEHMVSSRRTSAHVQTIFEVDMSSIVRLRENRKEAFERKEGVKLTYMPFLVQALVETVREFPILNSSVSGESIVFKKSVNVGIAVALETGLIVPVIRDAQQKSFAELACAIHDFAERARTKKLLPEEVQQGTITITNPGVYGSLFGTPIINQPQVAILGVGTLEKRPVIIQDAIAIRTMAYLVLSFDHRVIDGAVADQSMAALKRRLQNWSNTIE